MSTQNNGALFEESSQGGVSAVTAISFILSFVLTVGGFILMSYGFNPSMGGTFELWMFTGGLIATIVGFALPFALLPLTGK